jgi:hypothetical protein
MFGLVLALCAFAPPQPTRVTSTQLRSSTRRELIGRTIWAAGATAAGLALPMAPVSAVAPPSPQQILKSRAVYGSRVYRLQKASPATILDEKSVFTLFITGVYASTADKPTRKQLEGIAKRALAAAEKGRAAEAQAAVQEFVALARIEELDMKPGSYFNAKSPCDRAGLQCGYQYEGYLGSRSDADMEKAARVAESLKAQAK